MKIALLGSGKTGSKVAELYQNTTIFDRSNPPNLESLSHCDVVVCFLPGPDFLKYIDLLIHSNLPVVVGSTGFDWPLELESSIINKKLRWIKAHNFSLGMNIVKNMIEQLSLGSKLMQNPIFHIHDIHHTQKKDSPSGTALSWRDWLGLDASITAERTGDIVGYHHLEMISATEKIKLTHEALDRGIFAEGAIWSAKKLIEDETIPFGISHFSDIVKKYLNI